MPMPQRRPIKTAATRLIAVHQLQQFCRITTSLVDSDGFTVPRKGDASA